jgi:hypothetical protein
MGVLRVEISDETEAAFRIELLRRKGAKKEALAEAVEEALQMWTYREIWVQDVLESQAEDYISSSETRDPELEYIIGPSVNRKIMYVGVYNRLRKDDLK